MKITLQILEGEQTVVSKVLDEGVYRIGRSDFCDIILKDDNISRSHVELRVTESCVYMTNMSSAGKVKLNGKPSETAEVSDGDELRIGPYRVIVFHGEREFEAPIEPKPLEEAPVENSAEPKLESSNEPIPLRPPPRSFQDEPMLAVEGTAAIQRAETQVEIKPVVAKLMLVEGPRKGEEFFLEAFEMTFGRSKKADIFLDDEKLSRIHAKITRVGMGYRLIDLNSRNGTYVNGMRILEHPLASFDQIEIGRSKIKFLIHDIVAGAISGGALVGPLDQTKSVQLNPNNPAMLEELRRDVGQSDHAPLYSGQVRSTVQRIKIYYQNLPKRAKVYLTAGLVLLLFFLLLPGEKPKPRVEAQTTGKDKLADVKIPPALPKEYVDLAPEVQRMIEGHYNSAVKAGDKEQFDEAVNHLKKIHEVLPYYKDSRDRFEQYSKRLKEKQILEAQEKARKDEKQDLAIYLEEGIDYLKEGDFERASESFNSAIVIDPNNATAIKGLKAAEFKIRDIEKVPPERDVEKEKRKKVAELFQKAVAAFSNKSYQEAIDSAEKIRQIELKGDTQYLNEAKQIIDRARMLQKEEFEPFLIQAKEKYAEADYNASRDLCEEMLKRDPAYDEAKECVLKAKKQLNRLAKEAYTHGYILESMNRIEEAKQFWNRAKNYVRPGDDYYEKIIHKLDYYQ